MKVRILTKLQYDGLVRVPGEIVELKDESHFRGETRREKKNQVGKVMTRESDGMPIMELVCAAQMEHVPDDMPVGVPLEDESMPAPPKQFKSRQQVFEEQAKIEAAKKARVPVLQGAIAAPTVAGSPMAANLKANATAELNGASVIPGMDAASQAAMQQQKADGKAMPNGVAKGPKPPATKPK
jgi:hypothetical protein